MMYSKKIIHKSSKSQPVMLKKYFYQISRICLLTVHAVVVYTLFY